MPVKPERIVRVTAEEARQMPDRTDYARLDAMTDEDIAKAVAEDPDAAPLDIDWTQARLVLPPGKESVTLRVDQDVLDWFRKQGKGYQTRMNAVLRAYKDAHQKPGWLTPTCNHSPPLAHGGEDWRVQSAKPNNTSGIRSGEGCARRRTPPPISVPYRPRSGPC